MTNHHDTIDQTIGHDGQTAGTEHGRRAARANRRSDRASRRFGRFRSARGDTPPDNWQGSINIAQARAHMTATSV